MMGSARSRHVCRWGRQCAEAINQTKLSLSDMETRGRVGATEWHGLTASVFVIQGPWCFY